MQRQLTIFWRHGGLQIEWLGTSAVQGSSFFATEKPDLFKYCMSLFYVSM